ncbi:MAG: hypothetical protein JXR03_20005 [Cyclobacteriaceae bacterium]
MNVAFSTLVILVLLSPGFVCRYAFLKGPYSRKNFRASVSDEIFWSIIPAFFIQILAFLLVQALGFFPSIKDLYLITIGAKEDIDFDVINAGLFPFMVYMCILIIVSFLLGAGARWIVSKYNLDLKYNILKVNNEWYYLFSAKLADEDIDFIKLDVLVRSEKGTMLYSGILDDYFLNKDDGIDRLYLLGVQRDKNYEMPGDHFVIFGREILNINLTYFKLGELE